MTIQKLKNILELVHSKQISDFDMSSTTLDGKRLFRMGDIPRIEMPQLKGFARPASIAERLEKDHNGKACVADEFLAYMSNVKGVRVSEERREVRVTDFRGSQRELVASKVAKHVLKMLDNGRHKKLSATYIVSDEDILLDGHHGWAAARCYEAIMGQHLYLNTVRINCDIAGLIKIAREFTSIIGIENKESV